MITAKNLPRSSFDLSHAKKFSAEMGLLYPVACFEVLPNDSLNLSYESTFRASPLAAPILHRIIVKYHSFYVPYRILMDQEDWVSFITGGEDGDDSTTLPTWSPSATGKRDAGTLWDMLFGFQGVTPDPDSLPSDFPRRAYMEIFNEYYRDVAVEPQIDWSQTPGTDQDMDGAALPAGYNGDEDMQYVAWDKDYFTVARPEQQLGDPVSLAIGSATWDTTSFLNMAGGVGLMASGTASNPELMLNSANARQNTEDMFNDNTIASVDISELRLAYQVQKWQEMNMRAGTRYPEWAKAHYGVDVNDARIQRPEFIGGAEQPVVISDIEYQAEGALDPVGTLTGKGTSMNRNKLGKLRAPEFGLVMTLMSIRPKASYHQGIARAWTRRTRYDFYDPMFANLSEQAILQRELYVDSSKTNNETIFGYIPIWDELRNLQDTVHGLMAPGQTYDYWHCGRTFSSAPTLSASFIRMHDVNDDAWAVSAQPHFFVHHYNQITASRIMPFISTPGNVDR